LQKHSWQIILNTLFLYTFKNHFVNLNPVIFLIETALNVYLYLENSSIFYYIKTLYQGAWYVYRFYFTCLNKFYSCLNKCTFLVEFFRVDFVLFVLMECMHVFSIFISIACTNKSGGFLNIFLGNWHLIYLFYI
jgi:hypothetical protein